MVVMSTAQAVTNMALTKAATTVKKGVDQCTEKSEEPLQTGEMTIIHLVVVSRLVLRCPLRRAQCVAQVSAAEVEA